MINDHLRKTELRDEYGKVLLPRTSASMVSEEPDRRFVDNIEKSLISKLTVYKEAIENLSEAEEQLLILAREIDNIMPSGTARTAIDLVADNIDSIKTIVDHADILTGISDAAIQMRGSSGGLYTIEIDDSDGEPKLKLTEVDEVSEVEPGITPPTEVETEEEEE